MTPSESRDQRRRVCAAVRAGTVAIGESPKSTELGANAAGQLRDEVVVWGSGFVADARGIVITAKHVLKPWRDEREAMRAQGTAGQSTFPFALCQVASPDVFASAQAAAAADPDVWGIESFTYIEHEHLDLAAVLLVGPQELPGCLWPLALADVEAEVGDEIITSGFPLGLKLHRDTAEGFVCTPSLTSGIVSAILPTAVGPQDKRSAVQLDTTVLTGSSGGPVCDSQTGHVVAMALATWSVRGPYTNHLADRPTDQFVAFPRALPAFHLREFLARVTREWAPLLSPLGRMQLRTTGEIHVW